MSINQGEHQPWKRHCLVEKRQSGDKESLVLTCGGRSHRIARDRERR
jgi:hypothetical protein